jgi:hypothetical protein
MACRYGGAIMGRKGSRIPRKRPDWLILSGAAGIETTFPRLSRELDEAEKPVTLRSVKLGGARKAAPERQALHDAQRTLRILREAMRKS